MASSLLCLPRSGAARVSIVREEHELVRREDRLPVWSCFGSKNSSCNPLSTDFDDPTNGNTGDLNNKYFEDPNTYPQNLDSSEYPIFWYSVFRHVFIVLVTLQVLSPFVTLQVLYEGVWLMNYLYNFSPVF